MHVLWWVVITLCFVISFIGIVVPMLPAVGLVWLGVAVYHFLVNPLALTWTTWGTMLFFTAIILIMDELANAYLVKRYGGTKWTMLASVVGVVVGLIFFPPFGIIVAPFLFVFAAEILQHHTPEASMRVAFATLIAFLGSAFAKVLMQLIMIGVFLAEAIGNRL